MNTSRRFRSLLAVVLTALLALTLTGPSAQADHASGNGEEPGPIHAGNTFGWWQSFVWEEKFVSRLQKYWKIEGTGSVQNQHGMLTLQTQHRGSISATRMRKGYKTGRWEIRLRSRTSGGGQADYRVITELVPSGNKDQHCGARDIALNNYKIGSSRNNFYIRNLPNKSYRAIHGGMNLGRDRWHTYAVEVTPRRISWFVDAHVVATEKRNAAMSGVPLTVRFTMEGTPGKRMKKSRMQMDWLRYWSIKSPNTKSTTAPRPDAVTYHKAC